MSENNLFRTPGEVPNPKESREKQKIHYRFYFAQHANEEDFKKMRSEIPLADVIVFENVGYTPQYLTHLQRVADGKESPQKMSELYGQDDESTLIVPELMYGSKKKIFFADLPDTHPLVTKGDTFFDNLCAEQEMYVNGQFEKAMVARRLSLEEFAKTNQEREKYISERLEKELPRMIKSDYKLKFKPNIRVLVQMGNAHTSVFRDIKKAHPASRVSGRPIHIFSLQDTALRQLMWNKPLEDELVAQSLVENEIQSRCLPFADDQSQKAAHVARMISSQLSLNQIREISESIKDNNPAQIIEEKFIKFGLKLPQNLDEVNALIEKNLGKDSAYAKAVIAL